jgi:hypothetical protein
VQDPGDARRPGAGCYRAPTDSEIDAALVGAMLRDDDAHSKVYENVLMRRLQDDVRSTWEPPILLEYQGHMGNPA